MIITMKFVVRQLIIPFLTHTCILTLQSYYKYMAISKQQKLQLSEINIEYKN